MLPQQWWLKISWHPILPTSWLDLWLGHISTDVLLHYCPEISMSHWDITLTELIVIYKGKRVFTHKQTYTMTFSWHSMIFWEALLFFFMPKRIRQHAGWYLANTTYHVIWGPANRILQCIGLLHLVFSQSVSMLTAKKLFGGSQPT